MMKIRVLCLILRFLCLLRFPKGQPINEVIKRRYGPAVLRTFRSYEKKVLKVKNIETDIIFLNTCDDNNIIPRFTKFKLYNYELEKSQWYKNAQKDLLQQEIKDKRKTLKKVKSEMEKKIVRILNHQFRG